jgi:hypothetical protein
MDGRIPRLGHIKFDTEPEPTKIYPPSIIDNFTFAKPILVVGAGIGTNDNYLHLSPQEVSQTKIHGTKIQLADLVGRAYEKYRDTPASAMLKAGDVQILLLPENIGGSRFWTAITHSSFVSSENVGVVSEAIIPNPSEKGSNPENFNVINGNYVFSRTQNITVKQISVPSGPMHFLSLRNGHILEDKIGKNIALAHYSQPHLCIDHEDEDNRPNVPSFQICETVSDGKIFSSQRPFQDPGHHMVRIAIPFDENTESIQAKRAIIRNELRKAGGLLSGAPIDDPGLRGFYSCTTLVSSAHRAREIARKLVQTETDIMAIYANDFLSSTQRNPSCVNIRVWGKEKDPYMYMSALGCRAFYPISQHSYRVVRSDLSETNEATLEKMRNFNAFFSTSNTFEKKHAGLNHGSRDVFIALETNEKVFFVNQQRRGRTQAVQNKILAGRPAALLLGASPTMPTQDLTEMLRFYFKIDPLSTPKENIQ